VVNGEEVVVSEHLCKKVVSMRRVEGYPQAMGKGIQRSEKDWKEGKEGLKKTEKRDSRRRQ